MARVKKEKKYTDFLETVEMENLPILIAEAQSALKAFEKKNSVAAMKNKAIRLRNTLRIGSEVSFRDGGKVVTASVEGITAEKVQVNYNGKKRRIALTKLVVQ